MARPYHPPDRPGNHAPGLAFQGEHETTSSCPQLPEGLGDLAGATVLDVGAGTGILAIAALAPGATRAVLVGVDPGTVEAARWHVTHDGDAGRATVVCGEPRSITDSAFDVVCASLRGVILQLPAPRTLIVRATTGSGRVAARIFAE